MYFFGNQGERRHQSTKGEENGYGQTGQKKESGVVLAAAQEVDAGRGQARFRLFQHQYGIGKGPQRMQPIADQASQKTEGEEPSPEPQALDNSLLCGEHGPASPENKRAFHHGVEQPEKKKRPVQGRARQQPGGCHNQGQQNTAHCQPDGKKPTIPAPGQQNPGIQGLPGRPFSEMDNGCVKLHGCFCRWCRDRAEPASS